ncbi:MAG: hypothetical protein LDL13_02795 [Calditerrivibrio sp.]|nr:hypothetical protein [Calditerrivibrio sp.]MCA1932489.1 hypothetical protein [Calditerrivibrio sp.]MCA1980827.1 hypothetical protein [Calditerrivibrio sp.]
MQDVQDRSVDNKVVIVSSEFQNQANKNLEDVEELKKTEMVIVDKRKKDENKNSGGNKGNKGKKFLIPEEEEGKIIDLKG